MRRGILAACAMALLLCASHAQTPASSVASGGRGAPLARTATVVANVAGSGITIPSNFVGLSSETIDFTNGFYQGSSGSWTSAGNTGFAASYINLAKLLGANGVFRIGGGTSDAATAPTISAGMATNLNTFLTALGAGWTLIYGLDLVANDTATAATTASNLATAVGVNNVTFQFGNEPSLGALSAAQYETRWNSYYTAVSGAVGGVHVGAVDDIMNVGWGSVPTVVAALTPGVAGMSFISQHWYSFCNGSWASPVPAVLLSSIIVNANAATAAGPGYFAGANNGAGYLANNGKYGSVLQRMSETNTICSHGTAGMSDRMMASTWFINLAMILASNGWAGMNVHGTWGQTPNVGIYNPLVIQLDGNFGPGTVFYGMFLFSKIVGQQIVPSAASGGNVTAIATKGGGGNANIIIVNNDVGNPVSVILPNLPHGQPQPCCRSRAPVGVPRLVLRSVVNLSAKAAHGPGRHSISVMDRRSRSVLAKLR